MRLNIVISICYSLVFYISQSHFIVFLDYLYCPHTVQPNQNLTFISEVFASELLGDPHPINLIFSSSFSVTNNAKLPSRK